MNSLVLAFGTGTIFIGIVLIIISFDNRNPVATAAVGIFFLICGFMMFYKKRTPESQTNYSYNQYSQPQSYSSGITESDFTTNFARFSPHEMEQLVSTLFQMKGYKTSVLARTSYDRGIDVEVANSYESIGIQVKHWSNNVDADTVVKTIGASVQYNKAIIISTKTGFTRPAIQEAQKFPYKLELWDTNRFKNELRAYFGESSSSSSQGTMPKDWKDPSG